MRPEAREIDDPEGGLHRDRDRTRRTLLRTLYVVALLALYVNPFVRYAFLETWNELGPDWIIFYPAAKNLASGNLPYPADWEDKKPNEPAGKGWEDYVYPPTFARLLSPLTLLGPFWSLKAYLLVCFSLYCLLLFPRYVPRPYGWLEHSLAVAFFFGWGPLIQDFRHGQTDFIPLFLFAGAWRLLKGEKDSAPIWTGHRKELTAGLLMGFAASLKLTPVVVLPALLAAKRWRMAAGFLLGAAGLLVLTGPVTSLYYFTRVLPTMLADFTGMHDRPALHLGVASLFEGAARMFGRAGEWADVSARLGLAAGAILYASLLAFFWRKTDAFRSADLVLSLGFLPPIFAGDLNHHYVLALLPLMVATRRLVSRWAQAGERMKGERWWKRLPLRLMAVMLVSLPSFYYWLPVRSLYNFLDDAFGVTLNMQVLFGNLFAFLLVLPVFGPLKEKPPLPSVPSPFHGEG